MFTNEQNFKNRTYWKKKKRMVFNLVVGCHSFVIDLISLNVQSTSKIDIQLVVKPIVS